MFWEEGIKNLFGKNNEKRKKKKVTKLNVLKSKKKLSIKCYLFILHIKLYNFTK